MIIIFGTPKAQKRHRDRKNSKGKYDPSKKDKESFLAECMKFRPAKPHKGAIRLKLLFYFDWDKKYYRTGKHAHKLKNNAPNYHISTPDIDNLVKFVGDALNGVFWVDDSQIIHIEVNKYYGQPRTEIAITSIYESIIEKEKERSHE